MTATQTADESKTSIPETVLKRMEDLGIEIKGIAGIKTDVNALVKRLDAFEEQQKQWMEKNKSRSVSIPGVTEQKEKFSLFYAMRMAAKYKLPTKEDKNAAFTEAVIIEATQKALDSGLLTAGGAVIPAEYVAEIIDVLRPQIAAVALGATMTSFASGYPVEFPRMDSTATATWNAESAAITPSQESFGMINMTPHQLSCLVQMSRRSAALSNPGLEQIVRMDIAALFARAIDLAIFKGTGTLNQPLGIKNITGTQDYGDAWSGVPTYPTLVDFIGKVEDANAMGAKMGWAMHPKIKRVIQKIVDGASRPIFNWDSTLSPSGLSMSPNILTYPFATTTQLPQGTDIGEIYFGDFAQLIVGTWGSMILESSTEADTAFAAHQLWIKGIMEVDVALRQPSAFVWADNID